MKKDVYNSLTELLEGDSTEEISAYLCNYFNSNDLIGLIEFIKEEKENG